MDPVRWPLPEGSNTAEPLVNVLRQSLDEVLKSSEDSSLSYERLINRCQIHKCTLGYCLKQKRRKGEKKEGADQGKGRAAPCPATNKGDDPGQLDGGKKASKDTKHGEKKEGAAQDKGIVDDMEGTGPTTNKETEAGQGPKLDGGKKAASKGSKRGGALKSVPDVVLDGKTYVCRFRFPKEPVGYEYEWQDTPNGEILSGIHRQTQAEYFHEQVRKCLSEEVLSKSPTEIERLLKEGKITKAEAKVYKENEEYKKEVEKLDSERGATARTLVFIDGAGIVRDAEGLQLMVLRNHPRVNSNCLLYTSPSPRDKRQSRMPSSA